VAKTYLALALGAPADDRFAVEAALALTGTSGVRGAHCTRRRTDCRRSRNSRWLRGGGRRAANLSRSSRAGPRTGRQHQIRAHLHHAGLHLVGDKIYGRDEMIFDRFTRGALTEADRSALLISRQALHAWRLALPHPGTGAPMSFEAPFAADLQAFWEKCRS